jgi:hypothetical protein
MPIAVVLFGDVITVVAVASRCRYTANRRTVTTGRRPHRGTHTIFHNQRREKKEETVNLALHTKQGLHKQTRRRKEFHLFIDLPDSIDYKTPYL